MSSDRTVIILVVAAALGVTAYLAMSLMPDRVTNDMLAEKALRVLRPRVQQFADRSGHVPERLDELEQPEIVGALRQQIDRAGFDLLWLPRDDRNGVLIAKSRSKADVARAYVATVVVGTSGGKEP
jgi:hypothetical protein